MTVCLLVKAASSSFTADGFHVLLLDFAAPWIRVEDITKFVFHCLNLLQGNVGKHALKVLLFNNFKILYKVVKFVILWMLYHQLIQETQKIGHLKWAGNFLRNLIHWTLPDALPLDDINFGPLSTFPAVAVDNCTRAPIEPAVAVCPDLHLQTEAKSLLLWDSKMTCRYFNNSAVQACFEKIQAVSPFVHRKPDIFLLSNPTLDHRVRSDWIFVLTGLILWLEWRSFVLNMGLCHVLKAWKKKIGESLEGIWGYLFALHQHYSTLISGRLWESSMALEE